MLTCCVALRRTNLLFLVGKNVCATTAASSFVNCREIHSLPSSSTAHAPILVAALPTLKDVRWIRTVKGKVVDEKESDKNSDEHDGNSKKEKEGAGGEEDEMRKKFAEFERQFQQHKLDPEQVRRARMLLVAITGASALFSVMLLYYLPAGGPVAPPPGMQVDERILGQQPGIPVHVFLEKFVASGEVAQILALPDRGKVVARLHPGAQLDGRETQYLVANLAGVGHEPTAVFIKDLRTLEKQLNIPVSQQLAVHVQSQPSAVRGFEFAIGIFLLSFLLALWTRNFALRFIQKRVKDEATKKSGLGGKSSKN